MTSSDWKRTALSTSSSGTHGRSSSRVMARRPAMPDHDRLRLELAVLPQAGDGVGHRREVLDLAVDDGARRQADLPEGHEYGRAGAELELGGAHRAGADVESDYLCHVTNLLVTELLLRGHARMRMNGLGSCRFEIYRHLSGDS